MLLCGGLPLLSIAEVEALWKEHEDIVEDAEDAQRKAEEEQLTEATVENVRDATHVEVACLRVELRGMGHSLSLLLSASTRLKVTFPASA